MARPHGPGTRFMRAKRYADQGYLRALIRRRPRNCPNHSVSGGSPLTSCPPRTRTASSGPHTARIRNVIIASIAPAEYIVVTVGLVSSVDTRSPRDGAWRRRCAWCSKAAGVLDWRPQRGGMVTSERTCRDRRSRRSIAPGESAAATVPNTYCEGFAPTPGRRVMTHATPPVAIQAPNLVRGLTDTPGRRDAARQPSVANERTCGCGQALECSHATHCPRCGVTLHA